MTAPRDADRRKVTALAELPQAIEPPRDLWPQIGARIDEMQPVTRAATPAQPGLRRRDAPRLRWMAAAAMVASVAVGVWIGRSVLPGPGHTAPGTSALTMSAPAAGEGAALGVAYVSDPRYQHQRAALMQTLQARLAALPPVARAKVMASLNSIWRAKQDLEGALGRDPGNALLQELLVDTYQDEMRVLTDVHEASDAGRGI